MMKLLLQKAIYNNENDLLRKILYKKTTGYNSLYYYPEEDDDDQPEAHGLIHMLICKMVLSQYIKV